MTVPSSLVAEDSVMTCEDYDERNEPGIVEKVALLIAPLLASRRDPRAGAVTAPRREEAIVTVLLTMVNVVLRR